jgi:type II secretory pathway predicted ATPase ExeA
MSKATNKSRALFGLTFDPFQPDVPTDAYFRTPRADHFLWRVKNLAHKGGFALLSGEPGAGKSVLLRMLEHELDRLPDVRVGALTRPHCSIADLYRELGDLFEVPLTPHNRWAGSSRLRETWQRHIDASLLHPVLLIDEAQAMAPTVFDELRLLTSAELDRKILLTVVLAGDPRLVEKLHTPQLAPLDSRVRVRLHLAPLAATELRDHLAHLLAAAGNPALMSKELMDTVSERACGNLRAMARLGEELLEIGTERDLAQLDEQLFLEVFGATDHESREKKVGPRRAKVNR